MLHAAAGPYRTATPSDVVNRRPTGPCLRACSVVPVEQQSGGMKSMDMLNVKMIMAGSVVV